jgi:hypothetical protein
MAVINKMADEIKIIVFQILRSKENKSACSNENKLTSNFAGLVTSGLGTTLPCDKILIRKRVLFSAKCISLRQKSMR